MKHSGPYYMDNWCVIEALVFMVYHEKDLIILFFNFLIMIFFMKSGTCNSAFIVIGIFYEQVLSFKLKVDTDS